MEMGKFNEAQHLRDSMDELDRVLGAIRQANEIVLRRTGYFRFEGTVEAESIKMSSRVGGYTKLPYPIEAAIMKAMIDGGINCVIGEMDRLRREFQKL